MIESLFKQRSTLARLQSGPLAQHLPFIAATLHQEQYPPETVRRYVRVADGFGRWLCKHGLSITETTKPPWLLTEPVPGGGRRVSFALQDAGWQKFSRCFASNML